MRCKRGKAQPGARASAAAHPPGSAHCRRRWRSKCGPARRNRLQHRSDKRGAETVLRAANQTGPARRPAPFVSQVLVRATTAARRPSPRPLSRLAPAVIRLDMFLVPRLVCMRHLGGTNTKAKGRKCGKYPSLHNGYSCLLTRRPRDAALRRSPLPSRPAVAMR
jgi:hypothetical protein